MKTNYIKRHCPMIILVLALLPSACSAQRTTSKPYSLQNTTWLSKVTDSCIDKYRFNSDSSLSYYSCETLLDYIGNYKLIGDTLTIRLKGKEGDELLPLSSAQRSAHMLYKAVIKRDSIRFIEVYTRVRDKWIKDDIILDQAYIRKF